MPPKKEKSFVRNIARERTYQNQNEEYDEAYFNWCNDDTNQYSFNYIHDSREHSYMAGRGFIKHGADTAEQATLHNCLRLLGAVMLVMLMFEVINYYLSVYLNNGASCNAVYYSERDELGGTPFSACLIAAGINLMKYLLGIFIYLRRTRLPRKVALPKGNSTATGLFNFNAIVIMLMIVVIGRLSNGLLSMIFSRAKVDSIYVYMFDCPDTAAVIVSMVYNCLLLPVLCEIFFRGLVLQSFRQFGDSFAVVVSAVACGLSFYDITYIGYSILCSVVIGVFTVRSGSIVTAILMHTVTSTVNYMLIYAGLLNPSTGRSLSIAVYMLICAAALTVYSKLNSNKAWSFNIERNESELPFTKKVELMLSSNTVALWFVGAIVVTILTMRFLSV